MMHGIVQQVEPIGLFPSLSVLAKRERRKKEKEKGKKEKEKGKKKKETIGQLISWTAYGARFQQINQYSIQ